jgi:hypothetical protein
MAVLQSQRVHWHRLAWLSLIACASFLTEAGAQAPGGKDPKTKGDKPAGKDDGSEEPDAAGAKTEPGEKGKTAVPSPSSPDEAFVKEKLKDVLSPTTIAFLPDGRAHLVFDFGQKIEDHATIFTPNVRGSFKDVFRWTKRDEEVVVGGEPGLRLSDRGMALLNCWFTDDVEAEIVYLQYVPHTDKLIAAVVFANDQGKSIGSNFGTQCATFAQGRAASQQGKLEAITFNTSARIKLVVKDGFFQAHRDGREKAKMKYTKKSFASGRLGFLWGGSTASTVTRLEIKGKLDTTRMAKEIRKRKS